MGDRGLGKRKIRRNISLSREMEKDLKRLSVACNMPVSTMVVTILEQVMYNDQYNVMLQDEYCVNEVLRARLLKEDGRLRIM